MSSRAQEFDDLDSMNSRRMLEHHARNEIRKLSNDPYNRLHSIAEDSKFVDKVQESYSRYPVVENLRCGSWYVNPTINRAAAYFKSADGHYNAWTYNLRRPNIQILPLIVEHSGLILVDSTRSGKRIPDALSKTVPIWCAVVNRAIHLRGAVTSTSWDRNIYTPPEAVSRQEHWQIETRLEEWASALAASSYELPRLTKPIRPVWVTPTTIDFPAFDDDTQFYPIICLSASKVVQDGLDRREAGYTYVQGAGDDHESWSLGLTPSLFWRFKDEILNLPQDEVDDFVRDVVQQHEIRRHSNGQRQTPPTKIQRVNGLLVLSSNSDLPPEILAGRRPEMSDDYCHLMINSGLVEGASDQRHDVHNNIFLAHINVEKKMGETSLAAQLPGALCFVQAGLFAGRSVCISCDTGNDIGPVVALAALQSFFDENGLLIIGEIPIHPRVDKQSLKTRLQWIISSRPEANPSRTSLKRLNEFFMSPPR